jgi:hypothetical protein
VTDLPAIREQRDPDGRRVVLDADGWRHVLEEHPEMAPHAAAILATIAQPDHRRHSAGATTRPDGGRHNHHE